MRAARVVLVGSLAVGLVLTGGVLITPKLAHRPAPAAAEQPADLAHAGPGQDLTGAIARSQQRLRRVPKDWTGWAELGLAYVQQARITADPSYYPKADQALARSLAIRPAGNAAALIGMGALGAARHDFAAAERYGRRATTTDPYSAAGYGVLGDALVELGRYDEAWRAIQRMVDLRPDTSSYARASYTWELRGDTARAEQALRLALEVAPTPADAGFSRYYLAELAFNRGDLDTATAQVDTGLRQAPDYLPLRAERAKLRAARGDTAGAIGDYRAVTARVPQPGYLLEYGDLLAATGDQAGARAQYALVDAEQRLSAAQGVDVDLELALFDADHGRPAQALSAAKATWAKRRSILAADALGWALHANGRDAEALGYARQAVRLGTRSALLRYHLGAIEAALGQRDAARRDLGTALALNPYFSVRHAPAARAALAGLS